MTMTKVDATTVIQDLWREALRLGIRNRTKFLDAVEQALDRLPASEDGTVLVSDLRSEVLLELAFS